VLERGGPRGVLGNDRPPSAAAEVVLVSGPASGQLQFESDGSFTYTPEAAFVGDVTFTYRLEDGAESSNVVTVVITVLEAVEDLFPATAAPRYTVGHGKLLVVEAGRGVAAAYPASEPWLVELVGGPANGSLVLGPDGSFRYLGDPGFSGSDAFQFRLVSTWLVSPVLEAVIEVTGQLPVAADDQFSLPANRQLEKPWWEGLLLNDTLPPGDLVTAVLVSGPAHGTLTLLASGSFLYTPAADFVGLDQFSYRLVTDLSQSAVATVVLEVVNRAPVAEPDAYRVRHDTQLSVVSSAGVLANDSDPDGDLFVAELLDGPAHGTLVLYASGAFVYRPDPLFVGTDTFVYAAHDGLGGTPATVTLEVTNAIPTAQAVQYSVPKDTALFASSNRGVLSDRPADDLLSIAGDPASAGYVDETYGSLRLFIPGGDRTLLAGAGDADDDRLHAVLIAGPAHGTLTLTDSGAFLYVPDPGFAGTDSFQFAVSDGIATSAPATATITVAPKAPPSEALTYLTRVNGFFAAMEVSEGVLRDSLTLDAAHLRVELLDGWDVEQGTLDLRADGTFSYQPQANYVGYDGFAFVVVDDRSGSTSGPYLVTLVVANDRPTAADRTFATVAGQSLSVDAYQGLLSTASDANGHALTAEVVSQPSSGTVTVNADGSFTYTPVASFTGTVTFSYRVKDALSEVPTRDSNGSYQESGDGVSEVRTVSIEVLSDDLRVMELQAEAYLKSEQGRIAQQQAAAGRPLAIADAQREFAAHAAFSQAVRAAIVSVQDQHGTAAPNLRQTLLDAEADYAAAEAAAADVLRADANAAAAQRWTQESMAEEAYRQQRLLAEAAWRSVTEPATAVQLAAAAVLDETHRLGAVALAAARRDALAATEAAYVQADAAAHLQLAGEMAALRGSQDAQRVALATQRDLQMHALETAARNTYAAIENAYDATVSLWHDVYLADLAPHAIWRWAQIDAVRDQYNQAVLASGAAYAAGPDDRAQTAVLDLVGRASYLADVSAALGSYDATVDGLRQQYRQAVTNARLQRDQAHVAAGLALDAEQATLQTTVIVRQTQDDQNYTASVIAAQAAFASARAGAEVAFESARRAALATHAAEVFALSVGQEGAEDLARLVYRSALASAT
jgi:hypothetical protein